MNDKQPTYQRLTRRLGMAGALGLVVLVGVLGWRWQATLPVADVQVAGAEHAVPDSVRALARVDTGAVLYDIEPALIADRVRRHPWVEDAAVMRLPTGTLRIRVEERVPAALAMADDGTPAFYVDRDGFCMPLPDSAGYDVPLLYGLAGAYSPTRPVAYEAVREMLAALSTSEVDGLVAELAVQPDSTIRLYTRPIEGRESIPVRLGRGEFAEKLNRLRAFWEQAVAVRPNTRFSLIDLRFDSQIVTQEAPSALSHRRSMADR